MNHVHELFSQKLKANLQQNLTCGVYLGIQTLVSTCFNGNFYIVPAKKKASHPPAQAAEPELWCDGTSSAVGGGAACIGTW